jgi:NADPH:quinone reductase
MKALVMTAGEGPRGISVKDSAPPTCGPDEIRVGVKASALNRADLLQTMGMYPAPRGVPADIPGMEYAGEVLEIGSRVNRWKTGDRVMGLVSGGAWAEQLVTHEREAIAVPSGLDFARAAAIPEAFITAWDALVLQGQMSAGSQVLIHAVGSGVGTAALQLCALQGARAIGTGRNAQKLERIRAMGLPDTVLVTKDRPAFSAQVKALTNGRGVDVVLDLVGGEWLPQTLESMAPQATLMLVGLVAGASVDVPLRTVLGKRLTLIGTTLRARALEEKIAVARRFEQLVMPHFSTARLQPIIDETVPISQVSAALERLAANDTFGKTVLTW